MIIVFILHKKAASNFSEKSIIRYHFQEQGFHLTEGHGICFAAGLSK